MTFPSRPTAPGRASSSSTAEPSAAPAPTPRASAAFSRMLPVARMEEFPGRWGGWRRCSDPATAGVRVLILTTFDPGRVRLLSPARGGDGLPAQGHPALRGLQRRRRHRRLAARSLGHPPADLRVRPPARAGPPARTLDGVTDRELEVLGLVARGLSNTELAAHLRLSQATVKTHIGRVLAKLRARDRAQLVIVAYETGLVGGIPPGP